MPKKKINDKEVIKKIDPIVRKKFKKEEEVKYAEESFLTKLRNGIRASLPEYHKVGLSFSVIQDIDHWISTHFQHLVHVAGATSNSLMASNELEGSMITEDHKKSILDAFRDQYYSRQLFEEVLDEAVVLDQKATRALSTVLRPSTTAWVVGGLALGFSAVDVYHIMEHLWTWLKDYFEGRTADIQYLKSYADKVRKHVDKRTRIMIEDLEAAVKRKDWIRVSRIQKQLQTYGKKTGYMYEDTQQIDELSIKTLMSYKDKAAQDMIASAHAVDTHQKFTMTRAIPLGLSDRMKKRGHGIMKAHRKINDKLKKLGEERLDELSTPLLKRYVRKASKQSVDLSGIFHTNKNLPKEIKLGMLKKVYKRVDGTELAAHKLTDRGEFPPEGLNQTREMGKFVKHLGTQLQAKWMKEEMGAGAVGGAPTNNVGSGQIAGAAGDPPGGKNRMRKMMLRRKKKICEAASPHKRGTFKIVGYSTEHPSTTYYVSVNKRGKYLHTTSANLAKRHSRSGRLK